MGDTAMQTEYNIINLAAEAQIRWLKPFEVFSILKNYEEHQLTHKIPQKPAGGSLFLFNKRVLKFFRKDGHRWHRRKDQRSIAEAHERLKVGNVEALNCYYAHGEDNPHFRRRSYWMLDPEFEHIVFVHYRDIREGSPNTISKSQFSTLTYTASPSTNSFATRQTESPAVICELYDDESSPNTVEINSNEVIANHSIERTHDVENALRRIEQQLSLNDDELKESSTFDNHNNSSQDLSDFLYDYDLSGQTSNDSDALFLLHHLDGGIQQQGTEDDIWNGMLGDSGNLTSAELQLQQNGQYATQPYAMILQDVSLECPTFPHLQNAYEIGTDDFSSLYNPDELKIPLEGNISLTIAPKQKFTIREISPEWCYSSEGAKVFIIGSFLCEQSNCPWACMFGDTEVPVQIIQEGVICCHAPPLLQGKVSLCITSGNRESCSEIREFEYRAKPNVCQHSDPPETEAQKSSDELLLLARFVQLLLSDSSEKGDVSERVDLLGKSRTAEDSWSHIISTILDGTATSSATLDWLLQELLKDKMETWLSSKLEKENQSDCFLSKNEQGIIHTVAGLGFQWALQPLLNSGVNVNFRDINGWTALHWAARFGREKMVAALIASGAFAGAVTDPNSQERNGTTAASIAAKYGYKGLAGYLSEVSLTSHLTSLTLEESELSKGSAAVEAERAVNSLSQASSSTEADQISLRHTLDAVRNATQAAARIQSAFRAHSFRKRQMRQTAEFSAADGDAFHILESDFLGFSKIPSRNTNDHNVAALSIQKKYKGWKGRKDFLALRQKVIKIQAHVRGYQVRKNYKVCWAVGILEKVILRWRRGGVGLRGFQLDSESIDEFEEDEDILRVFRNKKVDPALDEAVSRVLSMVECPEARKQYQRLLETYRQAKAELEN